MEGRLIHQYRIDSLLGKGGMGTVFLATDILLERPVAIKMLHSHLQSQPTFIERFRNEALVLARLNHPNIATLYNFLQDGSDYFMAMEYVEGDSLEAIIRRVGRLPMGISAGIIHQALEGLYHAHRKGVLHRDIKPANLILTPDGVVKLMDFGIARVVGEQRVTQANRVVGTLEYMAPELIKGQEPAVTSDIYAMGVLLYELLTGKLPFSSSTDFDLMQSILKDKVIAPRVHNNQIDRQIEAIVLKALEKDPANRFVDAKEFQLALQSFTTPIVSLAQVVAANAGAATEIVPIQPIHSRTTTQATPVHPDSFGVSNKLREHGQTVLTVGLLCLAILFLILTFSPKDDDEHRTTATVNRPAEAVTTVEDSPGTPEKIALETTDRPPAEPIQSEVSDVSNPTKRPAKPAPAPVNAKPRPVSASPAPPPAQQPNETGGVPGGSSTTTPVQASPEPVVNERKQPAAVPPSASEPVATPVPSTARHATITLNRHTVMLAITDNLSSSEAQEGQIIRFRVTEGVSANGEVVIPVGATAYGQVTRVKRASENLFQKKDQLEFRIHTVEAVNGQKVPLRSATISEEAKGKAVLFQSGQTFEVRTGDGVVVRL